MNSTRMQLFSQLVARCLLWGTRAVVLIIYSESLERKHRFAETDTAAEARGGRCLAPPRSLTSGRNYTILWVTIREPQNPPVAANADRRVAPAAGVETPICRG